MTIRESRVVLVNSSSHRYSSMESDSAAHYSTAQQRRLWFHVCSMMGLAAFGFVLRSYVEVAPSSTVQQTLYIYPTRTI
jgi:hypothetical protein